MKSVAGSQLAALLGAGQFAAAESNARELLALQPDAGVIWQILGAALAAQGKDSLPALIMAVRLLPDDAGVHHNLGNAFARLERFDNAVSSYRRAVALNSNFAEAYNHLAQVLMSLGQFSEALKCCCRAIDLEPGFVEAHDNRGTVMLALGRLDEAQASCQQAIALDPEFAEAHNNLGTVLHQRGQLEQAVASYRRALQLSPNLAEGHNNLGNTFRSLGQLSQAEVSYDRALQIDSRFVQAYCNRATVLRLQGMTEQAQASCRAALKIDPQSAAAIIVLAEASADRGEFAEAEKLFKQAASLEPESVEAWAGLARLRKMTAADASWLSQAQLIASAKLPALKEITLRYAIGKYLDDVREFDRAFLEFRRANELTKLCRPPHDRQLLTRTVDSITRMYDRKWLSDCRPGGAEFTGPVFIVGMLRSGTTLAEQILAAHPAVFGAGELAFWSKASDRHRACVGNEGTLLTELAADYDRLLRNQSNGAPRVVDKMPTNFASLGLIHAALPHARIIHMQRNPLDTCLSIYFQHFEMAVSYGNDLEDLAHYYREYVRIMNHWQMTLPRSAMLEVPYEGLVADQEGWSRRMLDFVGLPWDARCLDFYRTNRTIVTASKWQARQRISGSSVDRWRNYHNYLGPLLPLVGTQSPAFAN
jgi:tetratricopeptide (TPR) repeat protein